MNTTSLAQVVRILAALVGFVLFAGGVGTVIVGEQGGWAAIVFGGAILIIVALEQTRYQSRAQERAGMPETARAAAPPTDFERTDEVFLDPATGDRMRVWYNPTTGEQRYERDR